MSRPDLFVTTRGSQALLRGVEAQRIARLVAPEGHPPRWTDLGRGWVIPADRIDDAVAYAQHAHLLAITTRQAGR